MISLQKTVTSIFIVPLLGIRRERLTDERIGFINGYLMDMGREIVYEDAVYLLFKPTNPITFQDMVTEERVRPDSDLLDEYDYEGGYVVLVYKIPEHFHKEMSKFLNGKYSEFDEDTKARYPQVKKITDNRTGLQKDEIALQWRIFKKDKYLQKYWEDLLGSDFDPSMEVWSMPNTDRETLNIESIRKTENNIST